MDISLNEYLKEVCLIDCRYGNRTKDDAMLGIHEAVTKLWAAVKHGRDRKEVEKRIVNTIIGCLVTAGRLGVTDIEGMVYLRVEELKCELSAEIRPSRT